tara:strand:+ start:37430 stop:37612 length:183 start_codon:yes stop_codon:yes gene_type:complete
MQRELLARGSQHGQLVKQQRMRLDRLSQSALVANMIAASTKTGKQANAAAKAALRGVSLP